MRRPAPRPHDSRGSDRGHGRGQFIAGRWEATERSFEVRNPLDGAMVATVASSTPAGAARAIDAAQAALAVEFPAHRRYELLMRAADLVDRCRDQYADAIAHEGARRSAKLAASLPQRRHAAPPVGRGGAPACRRDAPVRRAPRLGAPGRLLHAPAGRHRRGDHAVQHPLEVAVNKLGPALAAGNAVVLKASPASPLSALRLAHHLAEAGLPPGRLNVVSGGAEIGDALVTDPRVRIVSFTGGVATGQAIARRGGVKSF